MNIYPSELQNRFPIEQLQLILFSPKISFIILHFVIYIVWIDFVSYLK